MKTLTMNEAVGLAITPYQPHQFDHGASTYTIMLPAHFLTTQTEDRDYCENLLKARLDKGYIRPQETSGVLAGSYEWRKR